MKLAILNYHGFETHAGQYEWLGEERPYVVDASVVRAQMEELVRKGYDSLTLAALKSWNSANGGGSLPGCDPAATGPVPGTYPAPLAVMITLDDGLKSHGEVAAPIFEKYGVKAVFFIPVELIGQKGHMDWEELKDLIRRGFEIGSHGWRHIPLTGLSEKELRQEFERSKEILENKLGVPIKSFSIPRGFFNGAMREIAHAAGYEFLFTSSFDTNAKGCDLFELKRMVVKKSTTDRQFSAMIEGNLGFRRTWEKMKENVRGNVPPAFYDALAAAKRMGSGS